MERLEAKLINGQTYCARSDEQGHLPLQCHILFHMLADLPDFCLFYTQSLTRTLTRQNPVRPLSQLDFLQFVLPAQDSLAT